MSTSGRRLTAALAALLPLCSSCAHRRARVRHLGDDIGNQTLPYFLSRRSDLNDPEPPKDPSGRIGIVTLRRWTPSPPASHRGLGRRPAMEQAENRGQEDFLRRPAHEPASMDHGPRPDDGDPQGRPGAQRPDQIAALPTTGQPHYFSPAPFKRLRHPESIPKPLPEAGPAKATARVEGGNDARAGFAPKATAALDDEVPETTVADPTALGSYHIQVATDPAFGAPVFDKKYMFMADIDLETDLSAGRVKSGVYWIRYSLIDLLEFEHPFSRPQRLLFRASTP